MLLSNIKSVVEISLLSVSLIFTHSFEDYLVLGKKNNKTGLIKFKSVKISGKKQHHSSYCLFDKPLNSNEQLLKLCEL